MSILPETVRRLWQPSGIYLDTASYGLPALPVVRAVERALEQWRDASGGWPEWNEAVDKARGLYARLVGTQAANVATGANVSSMVAIVAECIPDGAVVVAPDIDFASTIYPFLAQADRGVKVRSVPLAELASAVDPDTHLVAFSAVQSANGAIADIDAVVEAARRHGSLTLCDTTHADGWLPLPFNDLDFTVSAAYKWLMCPRGCAFMSVRPQHLEWVRPSAAGWFAKADPYDGNYYGPDMDLATDARRLDTSPAWLLWGATTVALQLLLDIGVERINAHDLELANRFRTGLGLDPGASAIVHVEAPGAEAQLEVAGIVASVRAGRVRASFHVYNSPEDIEFALSALGR